MELRYIFPTNLIPQCDKKSNFEKMWEETSRSNNIRSSSVSNIWLESLFEQVHIDDQCTFNHQWFIVEQLCQLLRNNALDVILHHKWCKSIFKSFNIFSVAHLMTRYKLMQSKAATIQPTIKPFKLLEQLQFFSFSIFCHVLSWLLTR